MDYHVQERLSEIFGINPLVNPNEPFFLPGPLPPGKTKQFSALSRKGSLKENMIKENAATLANVSDFHSILKNQSSKLLSPLNKGLHDTKPPTPMSITEQKTDDLEQENERLKSENAALKDELKKFKEKLDEIH